MRSLRKKLHMTTQKLISILLPLVMVCLMIPAESIAAPLQVEQAGDCYFVATDGSDTTGDGSYEKPYATLDKAVSYLKENVNDNPKTIYLRGGKYLMEEPIFLTSELEHTTICAFPGENVELTAKKEVTGDQFSPVSGKMRDLLPDSAKDQVVVVDLADTDLSLSDFPEFHAGNAPLKGQPLLLDGGKTCNISSHPNGEYSWEWYYTNGDDPYSITCDDTVGNWSYEVNDIWGYGFFNLFWLIEGFPVENINSSTNTVRFPTMVNGQVVYPFANYTEIEGQRNIKFVNVYEALDTPGEYFLDRETQKLYYYPYTDRGHIDLSIGGNITGDDDFGIVVQGKDIILKDLKVTSVNNGVKFLWADCQGSGIDGCNFEAISGNAVFLDGAEEITVSNSTFHDIGDAAVYLSHSIDDPDMHESSNVVTGNEFYDIGTISKVYAPAVFLQGSGCVVSDNTIHDLPHAAITFGGPNNLISGNDIYDVCQDCGDSGAMYSSSNLWTMGTVIEKNYIHNNANPGKHYGRVTRGIYLDDMVSGVTIRDNIIGVDASTHAGTFFNGGVHNTVTGNLFIDAASPDENTYPELAACMMTWTNTNWRNAIKEHQESTDPDSSARMPLNDGSYTAWFTAFPWLANIADAYSSEGMANTFSGNVCAYVNATAPDTIEDVSGPWIIDDGEPYDFKDKTDNIMLDPAESYLDLVTKADGHKHYELNAAGLAAIRAEDSKFPDLQEGAISESPTKHTVTVSPSIETGYVQPSFTSGIEGDVCVLTLSGTAQTKLVADSLKYNGQAVSAVNGTYYFTMPDEDVTITGDFSGTAAANPLTGITIRQQPNQTYYEEGDAFDPAGMEVVATWENGTTQTISNYQVSPSGALTKGTDKITVSYTDGTVTKTAELSISVNDDIPDLTGITIDTPPDKVAYNAGEIFSGKGMTVTAHYSDGTEKEITNYSVDQNIMLDSEEGYTDVRIGYIERGITKTAIQRVTVTTVFPVPWKIKVTKGPDKTEYYEGETFDPTGMDIIIEWNNDDDWETPVRVDHIDPADCSFSVDNVQEPLQLKDGAVPSVYYVEVYYTDKNKNFSMVSSRYSDGANPAFYQIEVNPRPAGTAELESVTDPAAITGIENGTANTAAALGLPQTVKITTTAGEQDAKVTWLVDETNYDPSNTEKQSFTVNGLITLPSTVFNTGNVNLWYYDHKMQTHTQVSVTVDAKDTPPSQETYKVEYVVTPDPDYGVPGDTATPVDTKTYHENDQVTVVDDQTTAWTTSDGTDKGTKGTWTFTPWDKEDFKITENTTITGRWTFTETPAATYSISYEVKGDDTYGIPTDGKAPATATGITSGLNYTLAAKASTAWTTSDGTSEGVKGTWEFTGWASDTSYADVLSQIYNITENKKVYGKWEFTPTPIAPTTYKVEYVVTPDPDYGVPGDTTIPVDTKTYHKNDQVTVADDQSTAWTTSDGTDKGKKGTWTFTPWDKEDFKITEDTTITGKWTFTPAPAATYSVSYEVKGDDTYGIPTDGKAPATATGITSGLNYTLAAKASTAWTTSDGTSAGVKGTWEFTGWASDTSYAEVLSQIYNITENKKVYGKWEFTPTPIAPTTYKVEYVVTPDPDYGVPGDTLTPVDTNAYHKNDQVTVAKNQITAWTTSDGTDKGKKGTWTFTPWDKEDFKITEDTTITGKWTFTLAPAATYSVSYEVKGDDTYGIPTDGKAPATATGIKSGLNYTLAEAASTEWTTSDGTSAGVKGTWEFAGWSSNTSYADKLVQVNNITENKKVYGKWEFTPTPTYTVTYKVEPDATYGLPSDVTTPVDSKSPYLTGTLVTVVPNQTTTETTAVNRETEEKEEGIWTFTPWDQGDFKITKDTTITGSWTFTPNPPIITYKVTYSVAPDATYGLPEGITTPVDHKDYHYGDLVTVVPNQTTTETTAVNSNTGKTEEGKWAFTPWDHKNFNITEDTTIKGSWTFTPTPPATYKVEYVVTPDPDYGVPGDTSTPVDNKTYHKNEQVTVVENQTTEWTTSDGTAEGTKGTWKFTPWDYKDFQITEDTTIKGSWKFTPVATYSVRYEVKGDDTYGIPTDGAAPSTEEGITSGSDYTLAADASTAWTTSDGTGAGVKGTWEFTGWSSTIFYADELIRIDNITENKTVYGKWEFTPAPTATYSVSYEVKGDDAYGIPTDGKAPSTATGITSGSDYTLAASASTAWTTSDGTSAGVKGTWEFTGWSSSANYADKLMQINNITENKKVYGKWKFIPTPTYTVTYKVEPDATYGLPSDVTTPEDSNSPYLSGAPVTVVPNLTTTETTAVNKDTGRTEDGTWTFTPWDQEDFKILANTTITGSWKFTPTPVKETYSVSYEVEGDDTYGIPTDGKAPSTATGITGGSTYTLAAAASTAWTTSDGTEAGVKGKWEFTGWSSDTSYDDELIQISDIAENMTAYGKWKFTPTPTYTVTYTVKPDETYGLPGNVTTPEDSNSPYLSGTLVTVVPNQTTTETTAVNRETDETEDGIWTFTPWDHNDFKITEDTTIEGSWKFTPNPPATTYQVTYSVTPDATYGLPAGVTAPVDQKNYQYGDLVTVEQDQTTTETTAVNSDTGKTENGTWKFTPWDHKDFQITEDTTIKGSWKFTPTPVEATYKVEYVVTPDGKYGVPEDASTPVDTKTYHKNDQVTVAKNLTTAWTTSDGTAEGTKGTWTFAPWDHKDFKITEDTTITGSWTFTPAPVEATYKVAYVVTPDAKYGVPEDTSTPVDTKTYHKNDQVTVAENLTTAWTTSDGTAKGTKGTWTFTPWDHRDFKITEDTTIKGSWTFTPAPVEATYKVAYVVTPDAKYGVPKDASTPVDTKAYHKNDQVTVAKNLTTAWTTSDGTAKGTKGTWTFTPWDHRDFKITEDTTIKGSWTFTPAPVEATYNVKYVVTPDAKYGVPQDASTPVDTKAYHKNDQVTVAKNLTTAWTTSDGTPFGTKGTWTFTPWDHKDFKITENTTIRGSWTFKQTLVVIDDPGNDPTPEPDIEVPEETTEPEYTGPSQNNNQSTPVRRPTTSQPTTSRPTTSRPTTSARPSSGNSGTPTLTPPEEKDKLNYDVMINNSKPDSSKESYLSMSGETETPEKKASTKAPTTDKKVNHVGTGDDTKSGYLVALLLASTGVIVLIRKKRRISSISE